jgi:hypothetical protein
VENPRRDSWRLWLPTPWYILLWLGLAFLQARYAKTWLIGSRAALQTVLQSLPATLIALFVLAFTTLFVAVQQIVTVFSSRAPLILSEDSRVRRIVARTGFVAVAALLLGGQVPDVRRPAGYITAAATTLLLMSVQLVYSYGRFVTTLIGEYSAPRAFVSRVTGPVFDYLNRETPRLGMVVMRVPLLGQVLRYALRRDDSEGVGTALEGLQNLQSDYIRAAEVHPEVRYWSYGREKQVERWIGEELRRVFVSASEEALRLQAPQEELDWLVNYHGDAAMEAIKVSHVPESEALLIGLAQLSTTPYQVTEGVSNYLSRPASSLAAAERVAEEKGLIDLAALALSCWAVAITYPRFHLAVDHPLFEEGLKFLGPKPPWDLAIARVKDEHWRQLWANKFKTGEFDFMADVLRSAHARRQDPHSNGAQDQKRLAYTRWLDVSASLATWSFSSGKSWDDYIHEIDEAKAALDFLASPDVKAAVQNYINNLGLGLSAVMEVSATTDDPRRQEAAIDAAFKRTMEGYHLAVVDAMRRDIGPLDRIGKEER